MPNDPYVEKYGLTLAQIRARMADKSVTITTPVANMFSAVVPVTHHRNIVDIVLHNNSANQVSCRLRKILQDAVTTRAWYPTVPISAFDIVSLNKNADKILNPVAVLTQGQNIDALRNESTDIAATVIFWDSPRN